MYKNKFFRYDGEWHKGKKEGIGKLSMADGSFYDGEFRDGEIFGKGVRYWASSGNRYEGEFVKGECHGAGRIEYGNGASYDGDFVLNTREGNGVYVTETGDIYRGEFHANKRHGDGTQQYKNGDLYEGNWVADCRHGRGILRFHDGSVYDGQWLGDRMHGEGIYTHPSGLTYNGLWIAGKPAAVAYSLKVAIVGCDKNGSEWISSPRENHEIICGHPLQLRISCTDEDGADVTQESGRKLRILCGIRAPKSELEASSLLDTIEDETLPLLKTNLGYDVTPYPLSETDPKIILDQVMLSLNQEAESAKSLEVKEEGEEGAADTNVQKADENPDHSAVAGEHQPESSPKIKDPFMHLPPTPSCHHFEQQTAAGFTVFPSLYLYPQPQNRVFEALEKDVENARNEAQQLQHQQQKSKSGKPRPRQSQTSNESDIEPTIIFRAPDKTSGIRPGRYIFLVEDVTFEEIGSELPEFLEHPTLNTTALIVKVVPPVALQKSTKTKAK